MAFGIETLKQLLKKGNRLDEETAEKLRDPVADGKDVIKAAEEEVRRHTASVTALVASNNEIIAQKALAEAEIAKYERLAQQAGAAKNVDDVRQALAEKAKAQSTVATFTGTINANEVQLAKLRSNLSAARDRIATAKTDQVQLAAVITGSKIRQGLAEASNALTDNNSALGKLGQLKQDAIHAQAQAEAAEEMANISAPGVALEQKYAQAPVSDDDVAKYMK
ncbi:hypothetical protein M0P65_02805 [Candidatus Gracilibacteria bacterium]|jgi:phage shock protein A|nr:hypothetical protein [Candidatus Gracilibacteria bacterium]